MPNTYFQFKQFRIEQGQTAMKVTTEGCVFGGLIVSQQFRPSRILDIGAGTGLLSLMLAQAYQCPIDAVEIEKDAADQARENFRQSPWSSRLTVFNTDIQGFAEAASSVHKYDLIISNPPFFAAHMLSGDRKKDQAIHQHSLTQATLAKTASQLLSHEGYFAVIYPLHEAEQFVKVGAERQLQVQTAITLFDRIAKPIRQMLFFRFANVDEVILRHFTIKNKDGSYTEQMVDLLREYYLQF